MAFITILNNLGRRFSVKTLSGCHLMTESEFAVITFTIYTEYQEFSLLK